MLFEQFVGGSYTGASPTVDSERSVNWRPRRVEAPGGKAQYVLEPTPGYTLYGACTGAQFIYESFELNGRVFFVCDNGLWENTTSGAQGAMTQRMTWTSGGGVFTPNQISVAATSKEILVCYLRTGYLFNLNSNTGVTMPHTGTYAGWSSLAQQVISYDGYFVSFDQNSQNLNCSNLYDGTTWNAANVLSLRGGPDYLQGLAVRQRELFVFGKVRTEILYDAGSVAGTTFPFARNNNVYLDVGCFSAATIQNLNGTLYWFGSDAAGRGCVYRLNGYAPERISHHAMEQTIQSWGDDTLANAAAYTLQREGHSYYVLNFPRPSSGGTGGGTWVYDLGAGLWHEWLSWTGSAYQAHPAVTHCYTNIGSGVTCYHLIAGLGANVYALSNAALTDNGQAIKRTRTAPHLIHELKRLFYQGFAVDCNVGVNDDGTAQASAPSLSLSWSDDGGLTFNTPKTLVLPIGNYQTRVTWRRLGHARDRVFQVTTSDAARITLNNAFLDLRPGTS